MSMNAQVVKLMKGNKVVATYKASQVDNVVFGKAITTGTAKRTGDIDVKWVQLWQNGPKFAEYNVGAANNNAEDYGGYYCWGKSTDKDPNGKYKSGTRALTGTDDTATNLWGSNWRMPTKAEFEALLANCDVEWTTVNGVNGCKFTGKGDYVNNNLFFAAAGLYYHGQFFDQGDQFQYWSSESYEESLYAYALVFCSDDQPDDEHILACPLMSGFSVRAVLAE